MSRPALPAVDAVVRGLRGALCEHGSALAGLPQARRRARAAARRSVAARPAGGRAASSGQDRPRERSAGGGGCAGRARARTSGSSPSWPWPCARPRPPPPARGACPRGRPYPNPRFGGSAPCAAARRRAALRRLACGACTLRQKAGPEHHPAASKRVSASAVRPGRIQASAVSASRALRQETCSGWSFEPCPG